MKTSGDRELALPVLLRPNGRLCLCGFVSTSGLEMGRRGSHGLDGDLDLDVLRVSCEEGPRI